MTTEKNSITGCLYRGAQNDPEIRFVYPAANTYCYKASPPARINTEHQSACCLHENHVNCPVFQRKETTTFPIELKATTPKGFKNAPTLRSSFLVWILLGVVLMAGGGIVWGQLNSTAPEPTVQALVPVPSATSTLIPTPTIVRVSPSATLAQPTDTPLPTNTATATNTPTPTETAVPTSTATPTKTATPRPTATATPVTVDVIILGDRLNMRRGPSIGYESILLIQDVGQTVDALGRSADNDWVKICCIDDEEGWVSADFITADDILQLPVHPTPDTIVTVTNARLAIRNSPSYGAVTNTFAEQDDQFIVINRDGDWIELGSNEGESIGWVFSGAVRVDGDLALVEEG